MTAFQPIRASVLIGVLAALPTLKLRWGGVRPTQTLGTENGRGVIPKGKIKVLWL